jgi:hypothetical protein
MARIPFGGSFIRKGFRVNGTTTSANKISKLEKAGIIPFISIETDGFWCDRRFLERQLNSDY